MSGKPRRRVTVENTKPLSESSEGKRKPSVFERLGPGAPPRNFDQQQSGSSGGERYEKQRACNTFMKTGSCNYKGCRYSHPQRSRESDDLRHKVGRRHDTQSEDSPDESDSEVERKRSRERRRHKRTSRSHEKEGKIKSTVVMTKKNVPEVSDDSGSGQWDASADDFDRDFESELELEKRRQQLQRELLNLQEAEASESPRETMIIERQVREQSSSDSDSSVSTPPQKKDKRDSGRGPIEDAHRKKAMLKDKRKRVKKVAPPPKAKPVRAASPAHERSRERDSRRREESHPRRRPVRESSSDDDDEDDTSPEPRPEKDRSRRRSTPDQRQRKRSPSSSEERAKSSVERRRKSPAVEHHQKSPDKRRRTSLPPKERALKDRDSEREREREKDRERLDREKERERERERERPKAREKDRHEPVRKPVKESPVKKGGRAVGRKAPTQDESPRHEKRQRLDTPEYERKSHPPKRSVTPDERHERHTQSKERRSAQESESKAKRSFSPKDLTPKSRKHVSPADYKRSRTPEVPARNRSTEASVKGRRGRPEEPRPRKQVSPSESHKIDNRHESPEARPHRHTSAEGRNRREPREREERDVRDTRDREGREAREGKEVRDVRDHRDSHRDTRDGSREPRTNRENRETRETREARENKERDKDIRERDQRDFREQRDRDTRETRERDRDVRDRDGRDREQKVGREREPREPREKDRKPKENWPQGREDRGDSRQESRQPESRQPESRQPLDVNKRLAQIAQAGEVVLPGQKPSPEPLMERGRRRGGPTTEPRGRQIEEERDGRRGRAAHSDGERASKNLSPAPPRGAGGNRRRTDMSPEPVKGRAASPESGRRGKDRPPPDRAPPPDRGAAPDRARPAASRAPPRGREARAGREGRDGKDRERDDSRGPARDHERDGRGPPRDGKERDARSRDPKDRDLEDVRDTHSSARQRSADRPGERSVERLMDRPIERPPDRAMDRAAERILDRASDRGMDRGADRGMDRGADRGMDRGADRGMDRGGDRGMDRGADRGTDRGMDRGADRGMDRGSDRDLGVSPGGNRAPYDKSRSPRPPGSRRRERSPDPPRGRRHTPDDPRSQGQGPPPYDNYDAPMIHPDPARMRPHPPDLMAEDFTIGRGRMDRGRNDRFPPLLMHDDHFDRPLDRPGHGDRFDHGPDDRRDRYRDHYDLDPDYDRPIVDDDLLGGSREMWGDDQWGGPQDPGMLGRRAGRGGRLGRDEPRSRRGRGRGDGRRDNRDEHFRYDDDEYLDDPLMPHDDWGMWNEHPLDNRHPDNRRMDGKRDRLHPDEGRPGEMSERRGRMYLDEDRPRNKRMFDDEHGHSPPPKRREMSPTESHTSLGRTSLREGREMIDSGERSGRDVARDSRERGRDRAPRDVPGRERSPQERGPPERGMPSERTGGPPERGPRSRGGDRDRALSDHGAIEPEDTSTRDKRAAPERTKQRGGNRAERPSREESAKRPPSTSPARPRGRKRPRVASDKQERRGDKPWPEGRTSPSKEDVKASNDSPPGRKYDFDDSHGEEEAFSEWSDEQDDILDLPNRDDGDELDIRPFHAGERCHRSPSRSSLGSRKSHRIEEGRMLRNEDFREIRGRTEDIRGRTEDIRGRTEEMRGRTEEMRGRTEDIRGRNEDIRGGRLEELRRGPSDSWSNPDQDEWQGAGGGTGGGGGGTGGAGTGALNLTHRGPGLQGEPHSPLEVASTPPWEKSSRRRNRMAASGSESGEWERERPPPPPPGSFGEAEAAVRKMEAERNGEAPPPAPTPAPATAPTPLLSIPTTQTEPAPDAAPAPQPTPTETPPEPDEEKGELYDEISDDDLDDLIENAETDLEEKGKKTGVCDVLDINWSHLVKESLPKAPTSSSVLKRFSSAKVFSRIGVSRAFAGEALLTRLKHVCQKQMDKEAQEEAGDSTPPPAAQFELFHDVAALHAMEIKRRKERANILQNIGPYRRALCARRDLVLRRYMCRLDQESEVTGLFASPIIDSHLYRQSLQFFRQGSTERKFSNSPPEAEPVSA